MNWPWLRQYGRSFALFSLLFLLSCYSQSPSSDSSHQQRSSRERESTRLKISTHPSGAEVWIDGKKHGSSPQFITSLSRDKKFEVELRLPYYHSKKFTLNPEDWQFRKWGKYWQIKKEILLSPRPLYENLLSESNVPSSLREIYGLKKILGRGMPQAIVWNEKNQKLLVGTAHGLYYLDGLKGDLLARVGLFVNHQKLALAPRRQLAASLAMVNQKKYLFFFDLEEKKCLHQERVSLESLRQLAFSQDEEKLLVRGKRKLLLYVSEKGKWQKGGEWSRKELGRVSFSPSGQSYYYLQGGKLFQFAKKARKIPLDSGARVRDFLFFDESKVFLLYNRRMVYYDLNNNEEVWKIPLPYSTMKKEIVDFRLIKNRYLSLLQKDTKLWGVQIDTYSGKISWQGIPHHTRIKKTQLSPDGQYLLVQMKNRLVFIDLASMTIDREIILGENNPPQKLLLSTDNQELLVHGEEGIRILNSHNGFERATLSLSLSKSAYLAGNKKFLTWSERKIKFYNPHNKKVEVSYSLPREGKILLLAPSADGEKIAVETETEIWVARRGKGELTLLWSRAKQGKVSTLQFDRSGKRLALHYHLPKKKDVIEVVEFPQGKVHTWTPGYDKISLMQFSPSGYFLAASGKKTPSLQVYNTGKKKLANSFVNLPFPLSEVAFMPDEKYLLAATHNGEKLCILKLRLSQGRWEDYFFPLLDDLSHLELKTASFHPRGKGILMAFSDGQFRHFDLENHREKEKQYWGRPVDQIKFAPHNQLVWGKSKEGEVFWKGQRSWSFPLSAYSRRYNVLLIPDFTGKTIKARHFKGKVQREIARLNSPVERLGTSSDGKLLYLITKEGNLEIVELPQGRNLQTIDSEGITRARFSPENHFIAYSTFQPSLKVRGVFTGKTSFQFKVFSSSRSFHFLDRELFLFHDGGNQILLWDIKVGSMIKRFFDGGVEKLFLSPGEREFVYEGEKKKIFLYSHTGELREIDFPEMDKAAFSHSSNYLALAGKGQVDIYETSSLKKVGQLYSPKGTRPRAMAFTPDDKYLVISYQSGAIVYWKVETVGMKESPEK